MSDQQNAIEALAEHLMFPFTEHELQAWTLVVGLIMELELAIEEGRFIPPGYPEPIDRLIIPEEARNPERITICCHEIAHAIGRIVNMPVQYGHVGAPLGFRGFRGVQHSWLWTKEPPDFSSAEALAAWDGHILDPWVMGGYPRAQLVSCNHMLGQLGFRYRPIREPNPRVHFDFVDKLECFFREYMQRVRQK